MIPLAGVGSGLTLFRLLAGGGGGGGLAEEHHVHGREDAGLAAAGEVLRGLEEHLVHLGDSLGCDPEHGEHADDERVAPVGDAPHLEARPPGERGGKREVLLLDHLEADLLGNGCDLVLAAQPRERVAALDAVDALDVLGVLGAVQRGGDPLVGDVEAPRLEDAEDLAVDVLQLGRVAGGLDGVGAVEGGVREGHGEEVAADDLAAGVEAGLAVVRAGAVDLVVVDGDADDVGARVRGDGAHGATDSAPDVEEAVARLGAEEVGDALLVDARGVAVGASRERRGEVEGLAPPPLVDVGDEVVEGVDEVGHLLGRGGGGCRLLGAAEEGPVLRVLVLHLVIRDGSHLEIHRPLALHLRRAHHPDEPVHQPQPGHRRRPRHRRRLHPARTHPLQRRAAARRSLGESGGGGGGGK
ncbi:hypothetical protein HU200_001749 [Digitaria exilis]|uniref:Uncharacterized protein n=1 Tax=Digitaria exilis TaxID=1010633 RepID=A0A835G0D8_9POAL|nr:hypothetical protein HU200_001749 [Digitaria exilis]